MRPTLTEGEVIKLVLVSILLGMILGGSYDLFTALRVFRRSEKKSRRAIVSDYILCFFEDILFFLVVSGGNVVLFSAYGGGKVRLEGIVFQIIAFILWHMTIGRLAAEYSVKSKKAVKRLLKIAYNKTVKPLMRCIEKRCDAARRKRERRIILKYSKKAKAELKRKFRQDGARE